MATRTVTPLDQNWCFKQADHEDTSYLPVSQFPTNVHLDLIHHGIIEDPFIGKNEIDVQWVGEREWVYKTSFTSPALEAGQKAVIAFGGLDTFATVLLNGQTILQTDNMFIPERIDVTEVLRKHGHNDMVITFASAYLEGCKRIEQHPDHKWGCWNGDISRTAVRKAQYHWGWDWGPTLLTCGPWRPIELEVYVSRLADLNAISSVEPSLERARVTAYAAVEGRSRQVRFDLYLQGEMVDSRTVYVKEGQAETAFDVSQPALWYPAGYGKQPLYTLQATLFDGSHKLDRVSKRIGIRNIELVQRQVEEQPGTSFFFKVNSIPIFCGGSNWIPADSFIPRIAPQRYQDWIRLVVDGNQCMIRVWGGGIYEEQAFYDACDELGILVWQDFMFACANYPVWPDLLNSIDREARENIKLLRHHPCLAILAGNNEDYQYRETENLTYDLADQDPQSWLKTDFPARYIYEKLLVDACKDLCPEVYYHFGSPWSGADTTDPTTGDLHQWNVWHGSQERYQNFDKLVGRFVSEFGMEAFPSIKTIDSFLPKGRDDPDRYSQSSTLDFHNKAAGHERRLALYLVENIRYGPEPLEQYVYFTQLMQAECIATAYRLWRREWRGPGREYCGGALVWQINDCWPVTSWSICDYNRRPKHAYYAVKREMAPLSIGMTRREHRQSVNQYARAGVRTQTQVEVWGSNLMLGNITVDCVVKAWDVETGEVTYSETIVTEVDLPRNASTEIAKFDVPVRQPHVGLEGRTVVAAYFFQDGKQAARYVNWPEPLKYLHLQQPQHLRLDHHADASTIFLSAEVPVKGVALETEDRQVTFEDNLIDVVPGEVVSVKVRGATKNTIFSARYLGMPNPPSRLPNPSQVN